MKKERMIEYGLLGIILYAPFTFGLPNLRAQLIVNLSLLALFSLWLLGRYQVVKTFLYLPLLLFLILAVISTLRSSYLYHSLNELSRIISLFLLLFLVINNVRGEGGINRFIYCLLLSVNIQAFLGLFSYFKYSLPCAVATLPNNNLLAGYLVIGISFILALLLFSQTSRTKRIFFFSSLVLPFACLILTKSRGGLLSLMASLFVLLLFCLYQKKKGPLFILGMAILLFFLIPNPLVKRLVHVGEYDPHAYGRLAVWKNSLKIIKDYPLLGVGLGNFRDYYPRYKPQIGFRTARFAHNEYLQLAVETGLSGLMLFLWIIAFVFRTGLKTLTRVAWLSRLPMNQGCPPVTQLKELANRQTGKPENRTTGHPSSFQPYLTIAPLVGLTAILCHSLVDFNLHTIPISLTFAYLMGLIIVVGSQREEVSGPRRSRWDLLILGGLLFYAYTITQPYLAQLSFLQGEAALKRGEKRGAIEYYKRAISRAPICARYHKVSADLYWQGGYPGKALMEYKKTVALYPRNVFYQRALGKFYEEHGLLKEAREEYQKMVTLAPKVVDFHLDLGRIYFKEQNHLRAKEVYHEALLLDPDNSIASEKIKEIKNIQQ